MRPFTFPILLPLFCTKGLRGSCVDDLIYMKHKKVLNNAKEKKIHKSFFYLFAFLSAEKKKQRNKARCQF